MTCRAGFIGVAVLALALVAEGVRAQELQLKAADIQKLLPVLRADAAQLGATQAYVERQEAARTSFSGDPLEFFRGRADVDLPEGARYVPGCSRAASAGGPVAIFTFGRTIDCYERMSRDYWGAVRRGPHEQLPPEALVPEECDREHQQTSKFLDDVRGGLEKRGYADLGDAYGSLASADGIFEIALYPHNIYDRANPVNGHPFNGIENAQAREAALVACSDMPSGPILVLFPRDRFFAEEGSDSLDAALRKAGLSKTDYEALKEALFLARMYTKPEWRQAAEAAAGDDPAGRQALSVQLANADLYRKFAAELDPLLDALVPKLPA